MRSALHNEIVNAANQSGAMFIETQVLKDAVLDSMSRALKFGTGASVSFPTGNALVSGRFTAASVAPDAFTISLEAGPPSIGIRIAPQFTFSVELFFPSANNLAYLSVVFTVPSFLIPVSASGEEIHFDIPNIPLVTAVATDAPTRAAAIAASGITTEDLLRVEGLISYGSGTRILLSALGDLPSINLQQIFPAFSFGGDLHLALVSDGLVVIPDKFEFIGNTGCPQGDATAGVSITPQVPANPDDKSREWPVMVNVPSSKTPSRVSSSNGFVAAYLPKPLLDVKFGKVAPAVTYRDHGNGFIGYDIELSAAIRGVSVSVDPVGFGLSLSLSFAAWGLAVATIDVPCVGRMDLAQARFEMPDNNGTATVTVIIRFAVDTAGRLLVTTELASADLGKAMVSVQLFSKYLGMAGGEAAVVGFLLDAVIGRIIGNVLPGMIFDAIKAQVNNNFFVLANLDSLLKYFPKKPNIPTFSGDADSVLVGLIWNG